MNCRKGVDWRRCDCLSFHYAVQWLVVLFLSVDQVELKVLVRSECNLNVELKLKE